MHAGTAVKISICQIEPSEYHFVCLRLIQTFSFYLNII